MRKIFSRILALLFIGVIGNGTVFAAGGSQAAKGQNSQGPVTITYISSTILERPEGVYEQAKIDAFNAGNSAITVKVEGVASNDMNKKFIALATAGQMPDFWIANQRDLISMIDMDQAVDVRTVFDESYLNGFVKENLRAASVNETIYGIPWFGNAQGVLYRKDIFDARGIKVPANWDEFVSVAKQLTSGGNYGLTLVGTKNSSGGSRFQTLIRNFGVDEFTRGADGKWTTDINSSKYIAALKAFTDLDLVHHVVPPGVIETGYPEAVAFFSSGKAAMLITGSNAIGAITSQVPDLKGKLGSFPFPGPARSVTVAGGFAYMINKKTNYKQQAAEFIKFMLRDENALEFSELTGRLPTRTSVFNNPKIPQMPELQGFLKAVQNIYVEPTIPGYGEISDIHGEAYQTVFTKLATVEQAAAKAGQRAQAIVTAANK